MGLVEPRSPASRRRRPAILIVSVPRRLSHRAVYDIVLSLVKFNSSLSAAESVFFLFQIVVGSLLSAALREIAFPSSRDPNPARGDFEEHTRAPQKHGPRRPRPRCQQVSAGCAGSAACQLQERGSPQGLQGGGRRVGRQRRHPQRGIVSTPLTLSPRAHAYHGTASDHVEPAYPVPSSDRGQDSGKSVFFWQNG